MVKTTLLIWLLVTSALLADWSDCVAEIDGPKYGGSATLVAVRKDGHGLLISAAHVFEDGNTYNLKATFPAIKRTYPAKLLSTAGFDLAALDIKDAPNVELPQGIVAGRKNDGPFTCMGFPYDSRGKLRWTRGPYVGCEDGGTLLTFQNVRSGFSGGARFNRFGEYVGPISGMTDAGDGGQLDKCWGASGEAMLKFVSKYVELKN